MSPLILFLIFMIPGTFFLGIYDVLTKKILATGIQERWLLGLIYCATGILVLLPTLFITGVPLLQHGFWAAFFGTAFLNTIAQWMWYKAFQKEEASLISPLRLIAPPLTILTSFLFLKEWPSWWGFVGILTTILGLWVLLSTRTGAHHAPLKTLVNNTGIRYAALGAVSFAISFPLDKQAVVTSSAGFFTGTVFLVIGAVNILIGIVIFRNKLSTFFAIPHGARLLLPFSIFAFIVGSVTTFQALNYTLAAYASSVKRLWSFWAVVLSGVFLHEKDIGKKLIATGIMLAGVAITLLASV